MITLRKHLTANLSKRVEKATESLTVLEKINMKKATYLVNIQSSWEDEGEKSTSTEYIGTLKQTIEKAEKEFKTTNNRDDIQATYLVYIKLGSTGYPVPFQYWEKLRENWQELDDSFYED
jgi:hypothetical protein